MSAETTKPTLYDRLGGVYSIAAVVDDLIDRVMHNPILNANPAVPQKYTGRAMSESHEHLKITEDEWAAFCKDFDDTMTKFNVPEEERNELFAIVESTKGDIVCG